ncbi:Uncharacterised protein [Mycobacterium tuberculosis]|uniref:Uncharacterized protein n=1 Tax=Mycobacterium tuberculosis TaxID=1773 RepID=A0A916L9X6_MYCTX|nr:Uncharacterised protein [Mycobacterium tuberculosis]COX58422.1 Uncharacterised protein [Mycobacterium tuberculosis]SGO49222.1 Uncharacterised protein [Mycobacterium tuberculosis]
MVSESPPKSVPSKTVSGSSQVIWDLAGGSWNPSSTNSRVSMSNSRTMDASEPPGDRPISARV